MTNASIQDKGRPNKVRKVALMGDSIFDNEPYVLPGAAVIDQVKMLNKDAWDAELLAIDGATTKDVSSQCLSVSEDITHLVISIGGNDALGYIGIFEEKVSYLYEAMDYLAEIKEQFEESYQEMLRGILLLDKKLALCTIYNTCPGIEAPLLTALDVFNDVVFHQAFKFGVPVLDFRQTFNSPSDYSSVSPIEPSEAGGVKIAKVLQELIEEHDFSTKRSVIYH